MNRSLILQLHSQGLNVNQIAARLMIHKHTVEKILADGPTPDMPEPKAKKKAAAARKLK
jgi:transposase